MSVTYSPTRLLDGAKTLSYAANMLAGRLAREQGYDEALLVTPHGRVLEAPTSSIFYVIDGELFTPPLDEHILASITRALVIDVTGRRRARLHAGAAEGGRRGVPRLDRPRGDGGVGDRRAASSAAAAGERQAAAKRPASGSSGAGRCLDLEPPSGDVKILTVIGNRPQFIKAAAVSPILRSRHAETLVHTGQHFDDRLSAIFFSELGLPAPDLQLEIALGSASSQTGRMLTALEPVLAEVEPDAVLVYGDTNSTLAGALAGAQAGFRSSTSRRGCGRLTARCPRSSTGC